MGSLRTSRSLVISVEIVWALTLTASAGIAQRDPLIETRITMTGAVVVFPTPTTQDYQQGFVDATNGVRFVVNAIKGNQSHTTRILIRSTATDLGGGKPLGDVQWRRSDLSNWNALSQVNTEVELRIQVRNGLNDPWTNTIFFRILLKWADDPPATYFTDYQITLSQTDP
jgi:hypothetical protein